MGSSCFRRRNRGAEGSVQARLQTRPQRDISRNMEITAAISALAALAHPARLTVFRLLAPRGDQGLAAGEIAAALGALPNTTSANLAILEQAGLLTSRREGRHIRYAVARDAMRALLGFLIEDCCEGRPDLCVPFGRRQDGASC